MARHCLGARNSAVDEIKTLPQGASIPARTDIHHPPNPTLFPTLTPILTYLVQSPPSQSSLLLYQALYLPSATRRSFLTVFCPPPSSA